jgi:hypothetical protein
MAGEERRREQADDREPDAVGDREPVGDGPDVGDIPGGGESEREAADRDPGVSTQNSSRDDASLSGRAG